MALYIGIKNLIGKGAAWLRSKWTTIVTQLLATFRYRVAGGSDNALLPERKGRAILQKVYGNTVKWNQKFHTTSFTLSAAGTLVTLDTVTLNTAHKYIIYGTLSRPSTGGNNNDFQIYCIGGVEKYRISGTDVSYFTLLEPTSATNTTFYARSYNTGFSSKVSGYLNLTDVTEIFGSGNEPTTVEEFEAWLALNVGEQDYYPYDEGSLVSFKGQGVKSVGFNQLNSADEVLNGLYNWSTGVFGAIASFRCSVPYHRCLPSTDYYLFHAAMYWYDANKNFLGSSGGILSGIRTTPANAVYFRWATSANYYPDDICINLSDLAKNGTYKPYKEEIVDLSGAYINVWDEIPAYGTFSNSNGETFTPNSNYLCSQNKIKVVGGETYYFKINHPFRIFYYDASGTFISSTSITAAETSITLDSNVGYIRFQRGISGTYNHDICINVSNADINGTYFPHALQSAGSVADEDTATELTKKIFSKQLKDLTWSYSSSEQCMYALIGEMLSRISGDNRIVLSIAKYTPDSTPVANTLSNMTNMCYRQVGQNFSIKDTNYGSSDVSQFVSDLGDTEIQFELATPVVVPHDTPMQYAVDKYSTEELLVPASVAGEPTSTALVADIEYQAK